jgi:uracil-DNA glycosylase family 4
MGINGASRHSNNVSLRSAAAIPEIDHSRSDRAIASCKKCGDLGHSEPGGPYIQIGKGRGRDILLVAESPAPNGWRLSGRAFYTQDGKLLATGKRLNDYLEKFGLSIGDVSFTELSKCFLDSRKCLDKSCENCFEHLQSQLEELKPKIVITLGVTPNKIFAKNYGIDPGVGKLEKMDDFEYLPLYHPSPASPTGHKNNLAILEQLNSQLEPIIG